MKAGNCSCNIKTASLSSADTLPFEVCLPLYRTIVWAKMVEVGLLSPLPFLWETMREKADNNWIALGRGLFVNLSFLLIDLVTCPMISDSGRYVALTFMSAIK